MSDTTRYIAALRRILALCQQSRREHGGNVGALRSMRLQVEEEAAAALGEKLPRN